MIARRDMPPLLTLADLPRASEVQSRAFQDDPLWVSLVPDDTRRAQLMPGFFRVYLKAGILSGEAYGQGNPLQGVALWSRPDQKGSPGALVRAGILRVLAGPLLVPFLRIGAPIFIRFKALQKKYAPRPHFYLNNVGVAPEAQGKGISSALIRPFLTLADVQGTAVYTETMTAPNVTLYEHFGFRCMEQYRAPRTGLSIWSLLRPPRT